MLPASKRVVVAIGGNALIRDEAHLEVSDQLRSAQETAAHLADFIALGYQLALTHGNGPQVGFILQRSELAFAAGILHFVPLLNCVADTQGAIGYQLQESLYNALRRKGLPGTVATLVTLVEVAADDPSFSLPTKPIGIYYTEEQYGQLRSHHPDWHFTHQEGLGYRRVVPSPLPRRVVEIEAIRSLLDAGVCVIASGGGGIPVIADEQGMLSGVNAVIDKDLSSALLASQLGAELLVILTAVDQVYLNFNQARQQALSMLTVSQAREYLAQGHFASGSMGPKITAAMNFLNTGGTRVIITSAKNLVAAVVGGCGTHIVADTGSDSPLPGYTGGRL